MYFKKAPKTLVLFTAVVLRQTGFIWVDLSEQRKEIVTMIVL